MELLAVAPLLTALGRWRRHARRHLHDHELQRDAAPLSEPDSILSEAAADYRRGLSFIEEAFGRAREAGGRVMPCRRGCASCCAALFDVHPADALLLQDWLRDQDPSVRAEIRSRASGVLDEVAAAARTLEAAGDATLAGWEPREQGMAGLPADTVTSLASGLESSCPLLGEEGECRAHESRPALCRLQGLPWRDPTTGTELPDFCRLEPGMAENAPQELDLGRLDALRFETAEAIRLATERSDLPRRRSFVAAILAP